jgi:hypothetical protein
MRQLSDPVLFDVAIGQRRHPVVDFLLNVQMAILIAGRKLLAMDLLC